MAEEDVVGVPNPPLWFKLLMRMTPGLRLIIRFGLSTVVGVFVTVSLFYIMQALIQSNEKPLKEAALVSLVDFVRVEQEQELQIRQSKPKKPPPSDETPPVPPQNFNVSVDNTGFSMQQMDFKVDVDIFDGGYGISDGDYLPIVKVQPQYPWRAASQRIIGWVLVEFTVTEQGMVSNPFVVENCGWVQPAQPAECVDSPNSVFDSAATKAVLKFKYKPKVIGGNPVATAGVQNKINFELTDVTLGS